MQKTLRIAVIGDFKPANASHLATNQSLQHAAGALGRVVETSWLPTPSLEAADGLQELAGFDGFWIAPGSPYDSMEGALQAIRWVREHDCPCIGT